MKKVIYKISHKNTIAELHFVVNKGKINEFNVITEDEDLKFSLEVLLERDINFIATLKRNNTFGKVKLYINVPPSVEEFLYILSSILAWHGYKVEEVLIMKKDETLKSIKLLDIEDVIVDALEDENEEKVILLNGRLDVDDKLVNKSVKDVKNIILKSNQSNSGQFEWVVDENGEEVLKDNKVPAGFVAKNKETGKILVGGQFIGRITRKDYESGKSKWEFYPAFNPKAQSKEALANIGATLRKQNLTLNDILYLLPFIIESSKKKLGEKEELTLSDVIDMAEKAFSPKGEQGKEILQKIKDAIRALSNLNVQNVQSETKKAEQNITNPKSNLLDQGRQYYVFDPETGRMADYPTYLANKDRFSKNSIIFTDQIAAKRAQAFSGVIEGIRSEKNAQLLEKELEDILKLRLKALMIQNRPNATNATLDKDLELIMPFINAINSTLYRTGKHITPEIVHAARMFVNRYGKIPLSVISAETGSILNIPREFLYGDNAIFYVPNDPSTPSDLYQQITAKELETLPKQTEAFETIYRDIDDRFLIPTPFTNKKLQEVMQQIDKDFKSLVAEEEYKKNNPSSQSVAPYSLIYDKRDLEEFYKKVGFKESEYKEFLSDEYDGPLGYFIPIKALPKILEYYGIKASPNIISRFSKDFKFYPHQLKAIVKALYDEHDRHRYVNGKYVKNAEGNRVGMFFAHYTGTGKTVTGLSIIELRKQLTGDNRPTLIIAPEQIGDRWVEDTQKLYGSKYSETADPKNASSVDVVKIQGSPKERAEMYKKLMSLWAQGNLPKIVLVKISTLQKARRSHYMGELFDEGDTFASTAVDRFYLELFGMGGQIVDPSTNKTIRTEQGMFSNVIVDEASMIFSTDSQRRTATESIIRAITSDRGKGNVYLFNANAIANSAEDLVSTTRLTLADPSVLDGVQLIEEDKNKGPTLNIDALLAMSQNVDVTSLHNLTAKRLKVDSKFTPLYGNVHRLAPTEHRIHYSAMSDHVMRAFLTLSALAEADVGGKDEELSVGGTLYSVKTGRGDYREVAAKSGLYKVYLPGLISIIKDATSGAFSWRRLWEYGFLDVGVSDFKPFRIRDVFSGKFKNVSYEDAVVNSIVEASLEDDTLLKAISLFALPKEEASTKKESGDEKEPKNFIELAKAIKKEQNPTKLKKLQTKYNEEVRKFLRIYDEVQQLTRTFGLGAFEVNLDDYRGLADFQTALNSGFRNLSNQARTVIYEQERDEKGGVLKNVAGDDGLKVIDSELSTISRGDLDSVGSTIADKDETQNAPRRRVNKEEPTKQEEELGSQEGFTKLSKQNQGILSILAKKPLYFPGFGENWEKVDEEEEAQGTASEDVAGLAEGTGTHGHTGSERKVTIEHRNKVKDLALTLALAQYLAGVDPDKESLAFPVLEGKEKELKIKIYEGRFPRQTQSTTNPPNARPSLLGNSKNRVVKTLVERGIIDTQSGSEGVFKDKGIPSIGGTGKQKYTIYTVGSNIGGKIDSYAIKSSVYSPFIVDVAAGAVAKMIAVGGTSKIGVTVSSRLLGDTLDYLFGEVFSDVNSLSNEHKELYKSIIARTQEILSQKYGKTQFGAGFEKQFQNMIKRLYEMYTYTTENGAKKRKYVNKDVAMLDRRAVVANHNDSSNSLVILTSAGARGLDLPSDTAFAIATTFSRELLSQMLGRYFRAASPKQRRVDLNVLMLPLTLEVLQLKDYIADEVLDPKFLSVNPNDPEYPIAKRELITGVERELAQRTIEREQRIAVRAAISYILSKLAEKGIVTPKPVDFSFGLKTKGLNTKQTSEEKETLKNIIIIPSKFIVK